MRVALEIVLLAGFIVLFYFGYVWLVAWLEVRNAPRTPMFLCEKHGPIRDENLIKFQSSADTWVNYCPLCFHERLASVEKVK